MNLFVLPELAKGEEKKTAKAATAKKIEVKAAPAPKKAELEKKPDKKAEAAGRLLHGVGGLMFVSVIVLKRLCVSGCKHVGAGMGGRAFVRTFGYICM